MKNSYIRPDFEIIALKSDDIIATSPGTETPIVGEGDGNWAW